MYERVQRVRPPLVLLRGVPVFCTLVLMEYKILQVDSNKANLRP